MSPSGPRGQEEVGDTRTRWGEVPGGCPTPMGGTLRRWRGRRAGTTKEDHSGVAGDGHERSTCLEEESTGRRQSKSKPVPPPEGLHPTQAPPVNVGRRRANQRNPGNLDSANGHVGFWPSQLGRCNVNLGVTPTEKIQRQVWTSKRPPMVN